MGPINSTQNPAEQFADRIEDAIKNLQANPPDNLRLRVYCQGKDGEDFRVGNMQFSPSGLVILSGRDRAGNSMYAISHFQRLQFVCEISEIKSNEEEERKLIGFSR